MSLVRTVYKSTTLSNGTTTKTKQILVRYYNSWKSTVTQEKISHMNVTNSTKEINYQANQLIHM
ncbi:hypothetical protein HOLleu_00412 [Holothuria leucospilota]|uniref:Uncharacterized protein n=1 Tax=Holothuria leucospilota TaxID=206669 RepID=A0A9Q1CP28_HOLLE|nr:hypothetical protein HOLleu_00412 [Holothuria leucospilota]